MVLLGPSGCGKTTTLRMIAGFVQPTAGDILLDGSSIAGAAGASARHGHRVPELRAVPASDAWRATSRSGWRCAEARQSAPSPPAWTRCCALVKLEAFADRGCRGQLSGGQQQRVALARALAIHPRVLLLDEPLSNLDAALRQEMAREIRLLQRERGITTIMVTHDQAEAMAMADRLVVMQRRRRAADRPPRRTCTSARPSPFVAGFIGGSNILAGRLRRRSPGSARRRHDRR